MDVLGIDDLFARRSIRAFTAEPVTPAQLETLLKAAMAAPSAANRRPWHFVAVTDAGVRARLAEAHPHAQMVLQAPLAIVPCGEPALSIPGHEEYWVEDLAAATENLLLAATGLGLGAVWCGVHPVPERVRALRDVLDLPGHVVPFALVPVGHPAERKEPRTQYDASRVHRERW